MMNKDRIELHCHSKSGGFATMYPGEIVSYLSEVGMPAFAITDESSIGSYPELEQVWTTGKYTARPIFGMEMMVRGMCNEEIDYISVLIKNEIGKKTLYKIISENESEEPHPVFSLTKITENREGLLLGSGTEKGHLYKVAMAGIEREELKKIISCYDYIEVLPGKQYEIINKTIIAICDELKVPVVAVSDARYVDKFGRLALKIMSHWNKDTEELTNNHFLSTEEMLEAFDYLPKEKAYEIVVDNTHLIADMCETISVCPKEKWYPVVSNAEQRLKEQCYESLAVKFSATNEEAARRLDVELESLNNTGMASYVLQIKELLEKAMLKPEDISLRGMAAGSMVAYLLNITEIDPLKYKLAPEMIFGSDGRRAIDIDINIPSNRQLEVIRIMDELEGISKCVWAGTIGTICDSLSDVMIMRYMEDTENHFEQETVDKLRWLIDGNYMMRGRHPGGVIVFPTGCAYDEMIPIAKVHGGYEVTYFEYHHMDREFLKYDLLGHDTPEILLELEKLTGVKLNKVPVDSKEVLELFKVDKEGNVTGCDDLPEFKSEYIKKIIQVLKPKSFDDLVKVSALSHGTDVWIGNGEILAMEQGIGIRDLIATRDDVFEFNLALGLDRNMAFEIADAVRKGIVSRGKNAKWKIWKKALIEAGAPEWYIWSCEQIKYLFPRAHSISYVFMNMRLGWFKIHYPNEFNKIIKEYEELI